LCDPSFTTLDVVEVYALEHKLDISVAQDKLNLQRDMESRGIPSPNSLRSTMAGAFNEHMKNKNKTAVDLPLKSGGVRTGGQRIEITKDELTIVGRTELFVSDESAVMFAGLRAVRRRLLDEKKLPDFDGYYSLNLVVWCLMQVAVDKNLVCDVGMYVLWRVVNA
jgi:hypothetical protein